MCLLQIPLSWATWSVPLNKHNNLPTTLKKTLNTKKPSETITPFHDQAVHTRGVSFRSDHHTEETKTEQHLPTYSEINSKHNNKSVLKSSLELSGVKSK